MGAGPSTRRAVVLRDLRRGVQQRPVDIEHVDHIVDMRRYQALVESNFPAELNGLFQAMENKATVEHVPHGTAGLGQGPSRQVKVVGEDVENR